MVKYNCCVPGCNNSHRNKPSDFKFYCIPKDPKLREIYNVILRNDSLKVDCKMTRVCGDHWEGGEKLSRTHLPTLFPWSVKTPTRREIKKFPAEEIALFTRKRKRDASNVIDGHETIPEQASCDEIEQPTISRPTEFISAETQTDYDRRLPDALEKNNLLEAENEALQCELYEANKEIQKLKFQMKNCRFDIDDYKSSNKNIDFYTGFTSYNMLLTCYSLIESKAQNLSYCKKGNSEKQDENSPRVGRPRSLTLFQ